MTPSLLELFWANPGKRPSLTNREWETLLGQSRQASLLARLAAHHLDQGWLAETPGGPRPHLAGALRLADRQQHEVHWEVDCISRALKTLDVPVVLLKGAAYLMADLPPARGRLFSDIDLLVSRDAIEDVESALFAAGWISDERDPYNQRYYRDWMHEIPPLRHIQRNTYIDLHHTITPPTSRFHVDGAKLLKNVVPLPGYSSIFVLASVDMVLHSAVHLFTEGEFGHGLRDLLDLNDLVGHFAKDADFWNQLLGRSSELGLQIPLFHALFHLQRLFGTAPPQGMQKAVDQLGPNWVARQLMAWMLGLAIRPMHPTAKVCWTGLARWLLYVRSHVLRMPVRLVVPHLVRKAWMARFPKESK